MRDNLKALLKRLLDHDVDFVLAGGLACVVHGSPLVTQDIGDFQAVSRSAVTITLYGHDCKVVSLEDLISIKETMSRPKPKEALLHLREILQKIKG
jgi:predicted nucleotidyltransferase